MIVNIMKWRDFAFIVIASFALAYGGHNFYEWPHYVGFFIGITLGAWYSLFDLMFLILEQVKDFDDEEE